MEKKNHKLKSTSNFFEGLKVAMYVCEKLPNKLRQTHVLSRLFFFFYEGRGRKPTLADEIFPATPASNVCKATPRFPTDL